MKTAEHKRMSGRKSTKKSGICTLKILNEEDYAAFCSNNFQLARIPKQNSFKCPAQNLKESRGGAERNTKKKVDLGRTSKAGKGTSLHVPPKASQRPTKATDNLVTIKQEVRGRSKTPIRIPRTEVDLGRTSKARKGTSLHVPPKASQRPTKATDNLVTIKQEVRGRSKTPGRIPKTVAAAETPMLNTLGRSTRHKNPIQIIGEISKDEVYNLTGKTIKKIVAVGSSNGEGDQYLIVKIGSDVDKSIFRMVRLDQAEELFPRMVDSFYGGQRTDLTTFVNHVQNLVQTSLQEIKYGKQQFEKERSRKDKTRRTGL